MKHRERSADKFGSVSKGYEYGRMDEATRNKLKTEENKRFLSNFKYTNARLRKLPSLKRKQLQMLDKLDELQQEYQKAFDVREDELRKINTLQYQVMESLLKADIDKSKYGKLKNSHYVRYRDGMWIPTRKRILLYWFRFLQQCELSDEYEVDWSQYKGWGGSKVILSTKFDDWWEERWVTLFGTENIEDEPKFNLSTKRPKFDAYVERYNLYMEWKEFPDSMNKSERQLVMAKKHLKNVSNGSFP